jgi:hypothetical protein
MRTKLKVLFFQFALLIVLLSIVEIILRCMGYAPGDMRPNWLNLKPVDSLYLVNDYHVNGDGILIADSAYWAARNTGVNKDGFRSPDFDKIDSTKKKVLFIGDSFTWGLSANPVVNHCFVDLVRNENNYEVINLGIPATDPPQYYTLAKKYMPRFKPDITFIIFFMGNDLMTEYREVKPFDPFYYDTNAGAIMSDLDGIHFNSAQAVYHYAMYERYFLRTPKNIFEWVISKSALLSRIYSVKFRIEEKLKYEAVVKDSHITKKYLKQIQQVAKQNNLVVKFILVPEIKDANRSLENYRRKFTDILDDNDLKNDWIMLPNSKSNFNDYPDGHLNNQGHRHYADCIEAYLKDFFKAKQTH